MTTKLTTLLLATLTACAGSHRNMVMPASAPSAAGDKSLVIGEDGERYKIVVRNETAARFEIVASVDGLDVVDGKPADPSRRGYIVDPHGVLVIDGFRTSDAEVAAFRFGKVTDS